MEAHGLAHQETTAQLAEPSRAVNVLRRGFDLIVSLALILLLGPLLIGVAVAVRLDSRGSALFRQRRVGHREGEFTLYKFRSMRVDADPRGHQEYVTALIKGEDGNREGGRENLYKLAVDNRITPVGRWIRRWSLDELPQLFNVVKGDMTLVGPRPAVVPEVQRYTARERRRLAVTPGLTCIWQVSGRADLDFQQQVELDVRYIRERSLWLDFKLMLLTVPAVLSGKGAY